MRFLLGFIFGAAASNFYWNRDACEHRRRSRLQFREEVTGSPNEKSYLLESEEYKLIFNLLQKNPPKPKSEEFKSN